jgi:N-acyl homoserine lactone hydrolase
MMRIKPIPTATESPVDKGFMTYLMGHGVGLTLGVYTWYIDGAEKHVLVDTGASGEFIQSTGFPGITVQSQEKGLKKFGLTPQDIDIVILTHLHGDHAADIDKFTNASVYVQKDELAYAKKPHPTQVSWFVVPSEDKRLKVIDGDEEILPGIRVIKTPGHTPGGQSVLIDTDQGVLGISGLCGIQENFYPPDNLKKMGIQAMAPGIHIDALQAYDSVRRIQEMAQVVIAPHDNCYLNVDSIPSI